MGMDKHQTYVQSIIGEIVMADLYGNSDPNFGFTGKVPPGVSVEDNIQKMMAFSQSHTPYETFQWWYDHVKGNAEIDGNRHLSLAESMDYKQINSDYADFGNFNYAVLGAALGLPDIALKKGAGWAQQMSNFWGKVPGGTYPAFMIACLDFVHNGDNPDDQVQIGRGITAVNNAGIYGIVVKMAGLNGPNLMDAIRNQFLRGERWDTPIILDLDGDGVETTGVKAGAYFDHAGDGFAEQTGWVGADDGLLVYDRNGNGVIDSGAELFGNNTMLANGSKAANGFEALKELTQ